MPYKDPEMRRLVKKRWAERHPTYQADRRAENPGIYAEARKRTLEKAQGEMATNADDPRHGSATGYSYGCRCENCKDFMRAYRQRRRPLPKSETQNYSAEARALSDAIRLDRRAEQ